MNISRAEGDDLPRILAIQKEAYLSEAAIYGDYSLPPLVQSLEQMIAELEAKVFFRAVSDTTIVGSIRASVVEETCIIERLIVDPRFQRRGIGSALLAHAESAFPNARRYELFTGSKSVKNIELYEKHGYVRCREEPLSEAVSLVYMQKLRTKENESHAERLQHVSGRHPDPHGR